ncbi:hypothetical protein NKH36_12230 [Mesorhizobium sp. M1312]|uniref:hypothetical protein n=1 Tax=unclassified Mesorhizobium TaxID=325217 RepID=UPI003336A232
MFGDYGLAGNEAAGQELDRYDPELGSPQHAVVIASSTNHTDYMVLAKEEFGAMHWMIGGSENKTCGQICLFRNGGGGGGFFSRLDLLAHEPACNDYDNDVSR